MVPNAQLPIGSTILNRYEVLRLLGQGSSGTVYACRDKILCNWTVALKVFPAEVIKDESAITRLAREVEALRSVSHQNVAKFYELVMTEQFLGFAMEYVSGGTLTDKIAREHPLPIDSVISIFAQICAGLQAIHRLGVVHRDIKPDNILLTPEGLPKITDLGIVRPYRSVAISQEVTDQPIWDRISDHWSEVTQDGTIVGTLSYLSPEYIRTGYISASSDIYSVGLVGYELLTGSAPYMDLPLIKMLKTRAQKDPIAPSKIRPDCPENLEMILMKALKCDLSERYADVDTMITDLWFVRNPRRTSRILGQGEPQWKKQSVMGFLWHLFVETIVLPIKAFFRHLLVWILVITGLIIILAASGTLSTITDHFDTRTLRFTFDK
jgi:eukaryotic-like serine/threonine-protein kinase